VKERRTAKRSGVEILLNKYVDGFPHTCRALDISTGGVLLRRIHEPSLRREAYSLEIGVPGAAAPIWVWTRPVWTRGARQALRFVGMTPQDRKVLEQYVQALRLAA
jgi:hypothetical protein